MKKKNKEEESSIRWMNTNRRTEAGGGNSVGEGKYQKKWGVGESDKETDGRRLQRRLCIYASVS